jgi:hypothetical protein
MSISCPGVEGEELTVEHRGEFGDGIGAKNRGCRLEKNRVMSIENQAG